MYYLVCTTATVSLSFIIFRTTGWYLEEEPLRLSWPNRSPHMGRYAHSSELINIFQVHTLISPLRFVLFWLIHHFPAFLQSCPGLEQYAIKKFAEAFEALPRALAENSGVKGSELISKLYSAHHEGNKNMGFDIEVCMDAWEECVGWLWYSLISDVNRLKYSACVFLGYNLQRHCKRHLNLTHWSLTHYQWCPKRDSEYRRS